MHTLHLMISRLTILSLLLLGSQLFTAVAAEPATPSKAVISTKLGDIVLQLEAGLSPINVEAFKNYVRRGIYENSAFDSYDEKDLWWISGGKPATKQPGMGSNGNMAASKAPVGEFTMKHKRGHVGFRRTVGSCNPEQRSNSTQFTIKLADMPTSDGVYTSFATVVEGMDVVEAITQKLKNKETVPFTVKLVEAE